MTDFLHFIEDEEDGDDGVARDEVKDWQSSALNVENLLAQRPPACGVLQFHNGIEESLLLSLERDSTLHSPADIISAVDRFCYSRHWMMHIGPAKGKVLDNVVASVQERLKRPISCVELGSYCGYSTVRIASQFNNENSVVYSVEYEPKCCEWTKRMCNRAGLASSVKILKGDVECGIAEMKRLNVTIDILFIDHEKTRYLSDLKAIEEANLLAPGACVVADNVLSFGIPLNDYLSYVRLPLKEGGNYISSILYRLPVEYSTSDDSACEQKEFEDGIEVSVYKKDI